MFFRVLMIRGSVIPDALLVVGGKLIIIISPYIVTLKMSLQITPFSSPSGSTFCFWAFSNIHASAHRLFAFLRELFSDFEILDRPLVLISRAIES